MLFGPYDLDSFREIIIDLPWGQFQGCANVLRCCTIVIILFLLKAVPIFIAERQAREANILMVLEERG